MKRAARVMAAFALLGVLEAQALDVVPPPHVARQQLEGVVRIWGNAEMRPLLERWQQAFRRLHPQVRFENQLSGSDVGMAGLYTGRADIALLGRAAGASEVKAFEWIYRYRPERVEFMGGSLDHPGRSPALVAYVHRDNPLAQLSLAQLDAVFSHERLRGAPAALRTWGQLGLGGEWAQRPIRLYSFDTETGTGRHFREQALLNSRKLHWEQLREFSDGAGQDAGQRILQALAADRDGLAVASGPAPAGVKPLALVAADGALAVAATPDSLAARRYPLARGVYAYFNRRPGTPLDAPVARFLDHLLSPEGQGEIGPGDGYLRLSEPMARAEAESLRAASR